MSKKLRFELMYKNHPYQPKHGADASRYEIWGRIDAKIIHHNLIQTLFYFENNLETFIEWYINTTQHWSNDLFTGSQHEFQIEHFQKMDQRLKRASDDKEINELSDRLYKFSVNHNLGLGFPGLGLPIIIIASTGNIGEISSLGNEDFPPSKRFMIMEGEWSYKFHLIDFKTQFNLEIQRFLEVAINKVLYEEARERCRNLLSRLDNV